MSRAVFCLDIGEIEGRKEMFFNGTQHILFTVILCQTYGKGLFR